jgi:hypothetical protein
LPQLMRKVTNTQYGKELFVMLSRKYWNIGKSSDENKREWSEDEIFLIHSLFLEVKKVQ